MNKKTLLDRLNNKNKFLNNHKLIILHQYYYPLMHASIIFLKKLLIFNNLLIKNKLKKAFYVLAFSLLLDF